jgi:uncharacterized damage-inducible protein DinB
MEPQQEATLSELAAARQELLEALEGLSDADLESPLAPGEWCIRDMLAHINHWNRWGLNRLRYFVKHGEAAKPKRMDADEVNRLVAVTWALHPVKDVLMEFENSYEDAVAYIRSLPPRWTKETWEYRGKPTTLRQWFAYAADHERKHAEQVRAWRTARAG